MSSIKKTDHFYLIDGSGYIFRAYYALPPLSRKSDGLPTGAVNGFCSMLFKLLEDARSDDSKNKPTHFAVIFDSARKNFRNEIYSDYKANRAEAPDDLVPQFEYIRKSVKAFNLPSVELLNYEADDLIARWIDKHPDDKHVIISTDKDLNQLVKENVKQYNGVTEQTMTHEGWFDAKGNPVIDKKTKAPKSAPDVDWIIFEKAMRGDPSDNIFSAYPGVRTKGTKNKIGLQEAFADRKEKGYTWNNLMLTKWVDHDGKEHRVMEDYERNRLLVDLHLSLIHI